MGKKTKTAIRYLFRYQISDIRYQLKTVICYLSSGICLLAGICYLSSGICLARAEEKGELPEVVIKGEEVLKLESAKPKLEIPIEENREILKSLETEQELLLKKPSGWEKQPKESLPELTKSPQVIIPRTHHIRREKVCTFRPLKDLQLIFKEPNPKKAKKLARWELVVADDAGQTFREYSGQGLPPEAISFDGRDKNGKILEVGYSYSTVLRYYDAAGNLHTLIGNPFIIPGLAHQEPEGFFISLDLKLLYKSQPTLLGKGEFSDFGKELLQETADLIKKYYFTFPVNTIVYSKNKALAEMTAEEVSEQLARMLFRLKEEVSHQGKSSSESLERVEIIVSNR